MYKIEFTNTTKDQATHVAIKAYNGVGYHKVHEVRMRGRLVYVPMLDKWFKLGTLLKNESTDGTILDYGVAIKKWYPPIEKDALDLLFTIKFTKWSDNYKNAVRDVLLDGKKAVHAAEAYGLPRNSVSPRVHMVKKLLLVISEMKL